MDNDLGITKRLRRFKSGDSRAKTLGARLNENEEREVLAAAEREGKNASEWAREALLREARRPKNDPVFTEIVATRTMLNNVLGVIARGQIMTQEGFNYMLEDVRTTKHATACEVMQQYTPSTEKER